MHGIIFAPDFQVHQIVGVIGFCLYVTNYSLLTFHKLHSHDSAYFVINLLAASLVLFSLSFTFNLASALIQGFWVAISIVAIIVRIHKNWVNRRSAIAPSSRHQLEL